MKPKEGPDSAASFEAAHAALAALRLRTGLQQRHGTAIPVRKGDGTVSDLSEASMDDLVRTFIEGSGDARASAANEIAVRYCVGQLAGNSGPLGGF